MRRIQAAPVNLNLPPGWVLPQGWQAYAMFALLPLFWLIGLSAVVWVLVAIPLAGSLALRRGDVQVPRRFGIWLLLVLWICASAMELTDTGRMIAWAWRVTTA